RVAIGSPDSGAGAVAHALLQANRLDPQSFPQEGQNLGGSRAADALIGGELDAAFFIGPAENGLIQRLAMQPQLRLASLRRADAYQARLPYLTRLEVGEGMLDLAGNSPDRDILTLG